MSGRLVHLNGAPGVGKSTIARGLVAVRPGWLNLDIDHLRPLVGGWREDHAATGALIRPVALAMISAHVARGHTVVLPQMLANQPELERFVAAATDVGASYTGILLDVPDAALAGRWRLRDTTEPATAANNQVIASHGGDEVVLGWARRLRDVTAARSDVKVLGLEGDDVTDSLAKVESLLADAAEGPT